MFSATHWRVTLPWSFTTAAAVCQTPLVPLSSAAAFEVLAGSTVTNTGPTVITGGDLGLSPGSAVTGFPPGTLASPGVMHLTDPIAAQAEVDATTAYLYTAGLQGGAVFPGDLSGLTFAPGLYKTASTVMLSAGNVTLDAQGDVNAVFIIPGGIDTDHDRRHAGHSGGRGSGQERFLADRQLRYSGNELDLPGKYHVIAIHHSGNRCHAGWQDIGPQRRSHSR